MAGMFCVCMAYPSSEYESPSQILQVFAARFQHFLAPLGTLQMCSSAVPRRTACWTRRRSGPPKLAKLPSILARQYAECGLNLGVVIHGCVLMRCMLKGIMAGAHSQIEREVKGRPL